MMENLPESDKHDQAIYLVLSDKINNMDPKTVRVTPYKIEFTLEKAEAGVKWGTWGKQAEPHLVDTVTSMPSTEELKKHPNPTSSSEEASTENSKPAQAENSQPNEAKKPSGPPTYPTSAKGGPKNWEKLAGEEGDDEEPGDANAFFKTLFKDATPDQQRAMMKSFTESNGTALSTDWNDVKGRTVETLPPDGVEAKKW